MRDLIWLSFSVWIESDMFLCGGSKLTACGPKATCFKCHDRLTSFLCGWSKFTPFWDAGRKSLGFISSVSIEIDLVFVWVVDIDLISVWGVEIDLISFSLGIEIDMVCVWGSKMTWF